ncbi:MAG: Uma2 family endonuclease [Armatimonadetes bacterium]|nr:Uma2 family endonuclease [Armatimonadota bacterium]
MAVELQNHRFTPEEYLALEREADHKSEYYFGMIYAMAGSSSEHSAITANLTIAVGSSLRGTPCRPFSNDLKVRTTPDGLYTYPDLTLVCGEPRYHDERRDVLVNPTVLFEVLSPSTEAYDRGKKFQQYREIESLQGYVLVSQDAPVIEVYTRQQGNDWRYTSVQGREGIVRIDPLNGEVPLADVYEGVAFPPPNAGIPGEEAKTDRE